MRTGAVVVLSLSLFGCAAAFRGTKDTIHVESTPNGAELKANGRPVGQTPADLKVERNRSTELTLDKPGYETYHGIPKRKINAAWFTLDIATCVFPIALCIPLIVDAATGAWYDVKNYHASMKPGTSTPAQPTGSAVVETSPPTPPGAPSGPPPEMSESERKATARAAYLEGVKLQESGRCPEAIARFEAAQKFYAAPTHLLHLAQCQAATGKLVEASETYELLVRTPLTKGSPEAFQHAQETGKKELAALRPRVPTLRVQVEPAPSTLSGLIVKWNESTIPPEVLGIARPVNPGHYRVTVQAAGYKELSAEIEVGEGKAESLTMKLSK
jgi:hypothetical protein